MPRFYTKSFVEARQWLDTDENREAFAAWFEEHDCVFETKGSRLAVGTWVTRHADPGDWIVLVPASDEVEEFFVSIRPDVFAANYTPADAAVTQEPQ